MATKENANVALASLLKVQQMLKAPKDKHNDFGKYNYRSAESIFESAKPLCHDNGLILTCSDEMVAVGERYYLKAVAKVTDIVTGQCVETCAFAREDDSKKGMDGAQLTGCCSSYARKYALCGLFAIDDTKDMDTNEYHKQTNASDKDYNEEVCKKAQALNLTVKDLDLISVAIYKRKSYNDLTPRQVAHFAVNFDQVLDKYAEAQALG